MSNIFFCVEELPLTEGLKYDSPIDAAQKYFEQHLEKNVVTVYAYKACPAREFISVPHFIEQLAAMASGRHQMSSPFPAIRQHGEPEFISDMLEEYYSCPEHQQALMKVIADAIDRDCPAAFLKVVGRILVSVWGECFLL